MIDRLDKWEDAYDIGDIEEDEQETNTRKYSSD